MGFFTKKPPPTIFEVLGIDLTKYPDSSFILESNENDRELYKQSEMTSKYMGVFSELSILCFKGTNHKNFFFKSKPDEFTKRDLSTILEKIYSIYGKDDNDFGLYKKEDSEDIDDGFWLGRNWNSEKYSIACAISLNEEKELALTIWS